MPATDRLPNDLSVNPADRKRFFCSESLRIATIKATLAPEMVTV
jgi:hypothetical protein